MKPTPLSSDGRGGDPDLTRRSHQGHFHSAHWTGSTRPPQFGGGHHRLEPHRLGGWFPVDTVPL